MAGKTPRKATPAAAKPAARARGGARKGAGRPGKPMSRPAEPEEGPVGALKGMAAIVTGGDSGIGRTVALLFAREGADVALVYAKEEAEAEETRVYVEREGRRCITLAGDVRDPYFCLSAVKQTVAAFGRLDLLVNNAPHGGLAPHP